MSQLPPLLGESMEDLMEAVDRVARVYGLDAVTVATGPAALCGTVLKRSAPPAELEQAVSMMQTIIAHAAGIGPPLDEGDLQ